jgi:Zn-dependent protease
MRDPFVWSIPLGRLFGVTIRVHLLFPVLALAFILRVAYREGVVPGAWIDACILVGLLLVSVIAHEYGHCFAARAVNGEAHEMLIWPLGGLAYVDVPQTPRANFLTAMAGPLVNLLLCVICALLLGFACKPAYQPPWNLFWSPFRSDPAGDLRLYLWSGKEVYENAMLPTLLARLFYLNWWLLFWLNILLIGFPMDGGRMLQALLWNHFGYRQATLTVIFLGFVTMFIVGLFSIATNELLPLFLAGYIYVSCKNQWIILETGGDDALFGYDFSQGYTSLERDQPPETQTRPRRTSWWRRWLQKRRAGKMQREQERREAEEQRMDQLLEKVQRQGISALTDEERRFMKRVSDRYRNRN